METAYVFVVSAGGLAAASSGLSPRGPEVALMPEAGAAASLGVSAAGAVVGSAGAAAGAASAAGAGVGSLVAGAADVGAGAAGASAGER